LIIYPAIDIRQGRVVRLQQGDPDRQTIYADDPVDAAQHWLDAGAEWLHVVNLDGTLGEADLNLSILHRIAALGASIQFGGGIRSLDHVQQALDAGASRVILGTLAVQNPPIAGEAAHRFGSEHIAVALDARDGQVATHGWQQQTDRSPIDLGTEFASLGVRHALYTDISRDGELSGVNVAATADLARATGLRVIASGGVASLDDIRALLAANDTLSGVPGITGVITGQALYTGALDLTAALQLAKPLS
jgi:phosphoribosylformimino-5-aminoimidazole carboxamide ribotide isomerase